MMRHPFARAPRLALEIGVVLLPPLVWLAELQIDYALVPWSCHTGHRAPLHLTAVAAIVIAAAAGVLAWRSRPPEPATERAAVRARSRFLTSLGVAASALFVLVILTNELAQLVLDPCIASAG